MNENYIQNLDLWLSLYPNSAHPYDLERFYTFIKALADSGKYETFNINVLHDRLAITQPSWTEDEKEKFIDSWFNKIDMLIGYTNFLAKQR